VLLIFPLSMKTVKLGRRSMKALSQDTRVEIMKLLDERNHTQTEIAEALEMSAPSVKEHVEGLVKAGLIEKLEEGRKWKYFQLTQKGKAVLHPQDFRLLIVITTFIFSVIVGGFGGLKMYLPDVSQPMPAVAEMAKSSAMAAPMADEAVREVAQPGVSGLGLGIYLGWLLFLLLAMLYLRRHPPK